jgi:hypothetical protein
MKKILVSFVAILVFASIIEVVSADLSDTSAVTISLINQDPDPAIAGDIVEVRIGVENSGGVPAENTILELVPDYPFSIVPGSDTYQNIGTLGAYQTGAERKIVKFKVKVDKEANAGQYALKVKEYEAGNSAVSGTQSFSIDVKSKENAEIIYIDKTLLVPGKEDSLTFTINNVGGAPLTDLSFSWINNDKIILPVGSDNTKYIKYLDVGDSKELQYQVIADTNADAGLYELDLTLKYDDPISNEQKEIDTIAGVYVGGGTDFDVAFSESSAGQTSFTIANVGSNPAFSVSVIVPQQDNWRVSGSNSMIIGNLNTGDYTVASFNLQSSQMRSGFNQTRANNGQTPPSDQNAAQFQTQRSTANTLKVQIAYTDTMGKRDIIEKDVTINPTSLMASTTDPTASAAVPSSVAAFRGRRQQSFFSKYKWYMLVLIILIIVGVGYWKYRKEKKLNPHYKVKDLLKFKELFKKKKR